QQRRPARPDARGEADARAGRHDRRGGAAAGGEGDFPDQPLQLGVRMPGHRAPGARQDLARRSGGVRRRASPLTMLRVKFWGTRGSLPVALDSRALRDKLARVLVAASGADTSTPEKAQSWIDGSGLEFSLSHTFGGDSPCVQLDAGGDEYLLCDLGTGVR